MRLKAGADVLRPYRGRYVAQKDDRVPTDADNPYDVVHWLRAHGVQEAAIFRVPLEPTADMGAHGM